MNFVSRTSLRWALEGHIGGKEETEKRKSKYKMKRDRILICTVSEMNLGYSHPSFNFLD